VSTLSGRGSVFIPIVTVGSGPQALALEHLPDGPVDLFGDVGGATRRQPVELVSEWLPDANHAGGLVPVPAGLLLGCHEGILAHRGYPFNAVVAVAVSTR
jgi:hypothetical protein